MTSHWENGVNNGDFSSSSEKQDILSCNNNTLVK